MIYYQFPMSPFSQKGLIALLEKDIAHEVRDVMLFNPEHVAELKTHHPLGKVPLLVDGERAIPESSIIVEYLDQKFPAIPLLPSNPEDALNVRLLDRWIDNYVSEAAITIFFQSLKPEAQRDQSRADKAQQQLSTSYQHLENRLSEADPGNLVLVGDTLSLADIALIPALRLAKGIVGIDDYPLLNQYLETHLERASLKHVVPQADACFAEFMKVMGPK